jgi:large subunit ribosomal protein L24
MAKLRVKKGDEVVVIAGKDKGLKGTVLAAYPATGKVIVEGVNRVTKHVREGESSGNFSGRSKTGGLVHVEAPIDASNVMPLVSHEGNEVGTRVGVKTNEDGTRTRVSKRTGEEL